MIEAWAFIPILVVAIVCALALAVIGIRWSVTRGDGELRGLKADYRRHERAANSAAEKAVYATNTSATLRRELYNVRRKEQAVRNSKDLEHQFYSPAPTHGAGVEPPDIPEIPPAP